MLGFLRRNLKISSTEIKERVYKALVRPHLEYACTVWDPHTDKNVTKIESVQRRAARFVTNRFRNTSSVSDILCDLKWPTLRDRRRNTRLTMMFKILNGLAHCPNIRSKLEPPTAR